MNAHDNRSKVIAANDVSGKATTTMSESDRYQIVVFSPGGTIASGDQFNISLTAATGGTPQTLTVIASDSSLPDLDKAIVAAWNASSNSLFSGTSLGMTASYDADSQTVHVIGRTADAAWSVVSVSEVSGSATFSDELIHNTWQQDGNGTGHSTITESDWMGRTYRVDYPDGTFSETLYGVNGYPVPGHTVSGAPTITGYQQTSFDQLGNATDSFYDLLGHLTDVFQPAGTFKYSSAVLADTPVAYWRLGESSGSTALDSSGNGNNGTYSGGVTLAQISALTGDSDTSATFNGTSGYMAPAVTLNTSKVTIEAWIYMTGNPSSSGLVAGFANGLNSSVTDKNLYIDTSGRPTWEAFDGAGTRSVTGSGMSLNAWHHLVGTADGTNVTLYVDGTSVGSSACSNTYTLYTTNNLFVGGADGFAGYFPGKIDEVAVYSHALSPAQVAAHFSDGKSSMAANTSTTRPHWVYTYDAYGNETQQVDPNSRPTQFTYDASGNRTSRTLPEGIGFGDVPTGDQTEKWTYDAMGREQTHSDFMGNMTLEVYDDSTGGNGRLSGEYRYTAATTLVPFAIPTPFNPESPGSLPHYTEKTTYTYDSLGRQTEVDDYVYGTTLPTQYTAYTYDTLTGNAASIATPQGTVNYVYDSATGRKVRMWVGTTLASATEDDAYAYDEHGRLAFVYTLKLDGTTYGGYGTFNTTTHNPTYTSSPLITAYTYDAAGNLLTDAQPNGITTTYTYDSNERMTGLTAVNTANSHNVFSESYVLRADGMRAQVTDTRYDSGGTITSQTQDAWYYDAIGHLTQETLASLSGGANAPAAYTDTFEYDPAGNRTMESIDSSSDGTTDASITYVYTQDDQLKTETRTGAGSYTINYTNGSGNPAYDANGNQTQAHHTVGSTVEDDTYTWDLRGRMTQAKSITSGTTITTTYAYDTDGVRVSEASGGSTTYYLNDANNPTGYAKAIEESSTLGGSPTRAYILGLSVEGQSDSTNGVLYLLHDGHGSTRALYSGSVTLSERYDYDAFGDLLASTGGQSTAASAKTAWLFAGDGVYDAGTGWNYNLARWRDGFRFTSFDSLIADVGDYKGANAYLYAGANPVQLLDPTGQFSLSELINIQGIQNQINALYLPQAAGGINAAANVRQAVQLFTQMIRGVPFDSVSAIMFGLQFLPVGHLLESVGSKFLNITGETIFASKGVMTGFEKELNEMYKDAQLYKGSGKTLSQLVGDTGAAMTAKALALKPSNFTAAYHGLDGLMVDGLGNFVIVEAKGATSGLVKGQLGASWIEAKVAKIIRECQDFVTPDEIRKLQDQLDSGTLRAILVSTPVKNGVVQAPEFAQKSMTELRALKASGIDKFVGE